MNNKDEAGRRKKRSAFSFSGQKGTPPAGLKKRSEFLRVNATRQKIVTPGFILQIGAGGTGDVRVGFTASRKVGGAVERNRAKRKLRELVRLVLAPSLPDGNDYVLIARRAAIARPMRRLVRDAEKAIGQLQSKFQGS